MALYPESAARTLSPLVAAASRSRAARASFTAPPPSVPGSAKWHDEPATDDRDVVPPSTVRLVLVPRPVHALEDAELVRLALAEDRAAQAVIWKRYSALVRSKLGRTLGGQDVEDLVQEVFLRLFEYLRDLRDPAALRSFLIGITLRIAGTELRRRRCRWWVALTATGELPEPCITDDEDLREVVTRLEALLRKLAPESFRVFELRYIEGRELTEVAAAMGVSLATVKRHLSRVASRVHAMAECDPALRQYVAAEA